MASRGNRLAASVLPPDPVCQCVPLSLGGPKRHRLRALDTSGDIGRHGETRLTSLRALWGDSPWRFESSSAHDWKARVYPGFFMSRIEGPMPIWSSAGSRIPQIHPTNDPSVSGGCVLSFMTLLHLGPRARAASRLVGKPVWNRPESSRRLAVDLRRRCVCHAEGRGSSPSSAIEKSEKAGPFGLDYPSRSTKHPSPAISRAIQFAPPARWALRTPAPAQGLPMAARTCVKSFSPTRARPPSATIGERVWRERRPVPAAPSWPGLNQIGARAGAVGRTSTTRWN